MYDVCMKQLDAAIVRRLARMNTVMQRYIWWKGYYVMHSFDILSSLFGNMSLKLDISDRARHGFVPLNDAMRFKAAFNDKPLKEKKAI